MNENAKFTVDVGSMHQQIDLYVYLVKILFNVEIFFNLYISGYIIICYWFKLGSSDWFKRLHAVLYGISLRSNELYHTSEMKNLIICILQQIA